MWHVWERGELCSKFWYRDLKERQDNLEDLKVVGGY